MCVFQIFDMKEERDDMLTKALDVFLRLMTPDGLTLAYSSQGHGSTRSRLPSMLNRVSVKRKARRRRYIPVCNAKDRTQSSIDKIVDAYDKLASYADNPRRRWDTPTTPLRTRSSTTNRSRFQVFYPWTLRCRFFSDMSLPTCSGSKVDLRVSNMAWPLSCCTLRVSTL